MFLNVLKIFVIDKMYFIILKYFLAKKNMLNAYFKNIVQSHFEIIFQYSLKKNVRLNLKYLYVLKVDIYLKKMFTVHVRVSLS